MTAPIDIARQVAERAGREAKQARDALLAGQAKLIDKARKAASEAKARIARIRDARRGDA